MLQPCRVAEVGGRRTVSSAAQAEIWVIAHPSSLACCSDLWRQPRDLATVVLTRPWPSRRRRSRP